MSKLSTVVAALFSSVAFAGDVWVVDISGGGDFTQIQPAIEVASDGDAILVKSGTYAGFRIAHKGVAVVADTGASVEIVDGIVVGDTLVNHEVVLAGLRSSGWKELVQNQEVVHYALELDTTRGPVRVEDCELVGADGSYWKGPWCGVECCGCDGEAPVRIVRGLDVAFQGCTLKGGRPELSYAGFDVSRGGDGLLVEGGSLALHDCVVEGARGQDSTGIDCLCYGGNGGHGARILDDPLLPATIVYASGTSIRGGDGGIGDQNGSSCWDMCGNGGHGLVLEGSTTSGHLLDVDLHGGLGACHECGAYFDGEDGVPLVLIGGATADVIPGVERALASPSPVREATVATLEFAGKSGDRVYLLHAAIPSFELQLVWNGVLLLQAPGLMGYRFMGIVPPSGVLQASLPIPTLPPALESSARYLQSLHDDLTGRRWLGGHSAMVVLDQAF